MGSDVLKFINFGHLMKLKCKDIVRKPNKKNTFVAENSKSVKMGCEKDSFFNK